MLRVLGAVCAIVCLGASAAWAQSAPPASAFGRLPAIQKAVISPDGKSIAILGGAPNRRFISLSPIDAAAAAQVNLGSVDVNDIRWAGNGYLVIQTSRYETGRDPTSNRPFAYHFVRNVVIDANGKVLNQLLGDNANSQYTTVQPILGMLDGPRPMAVVEGLDMAGEALAARNSRIKTAENYLVSTLYRVDVATGKGSIIERGSQKTQGWDVDLPARRGCAGTSIRPAVRKSSTCGARGAAAGRCSTAPATTCRWTWRCWAIPTPTTPSSS